MSDNSDEFVGGSDFRSSCVIFFVRVFLVSLFQYVDSFINNLCFGLVMEPLRFSSYKYVSLSFLLLQPFELYR